MRKTKVKKEIPHEKLNGDRFKSDRHTDIGQEIQVMGVYFKLIDKVIYAANICPYCESKATFHRIIQENDDVVGNVWRGDRIGDSKGFIVKKFDYCLDCHKEFLFELYVWVKKEEKNKNQKINL